MAAALAARVEKIVYTSSVATLRAADAATVVDETAPLAEREAVGAYKQSKVAAERLVERMAADAGLPVVIVNPSTPIGPRDIKPTPTGRMVLEAAQGKIPAFVDTGLNLVHVDDVAAGHLMALEKGRVGERYVLGGQDLSLKAMLAEIAGLTGRPGADHRPAPRAALSAGVRGRADRPGHRQGADADPRCAEDGLAPHVLLVRQGRARARLQRAAAHRGAGRRHRLVPRGGVPGVIAWILIGGIALAAWIYLLLGRGFFWLARERDDAGLPPEPATWPDVVAVVPARNEADVIERSVGSLLAQAYPGAFRVVLVDDASDDGTAARAATAAGADGRLTILTGRPLPAGWTGKLWAVSQGVEAAAARRLPVDHRRRHRP